MASEVFYLDRQPNVRERYSAKRYRKRLEAANLIAWSFGLAVTSGYREGDDGLHGDGLAFDFGTGTDTQEINACKWAATHPKLFQEVIGHDAGSGFHAHIAFAPVRYVRRRTRRALRRNAQAYAGHAPAKPKRRHAK